MGTLIANPAYAQDKPTVHLSDSDRNVTPRAMTWVMIVCGDCAGDQRLPRKTFLAADGTCETCGGRSYLLASKFFLALEASDEGGERRVIDEATQRRRDLAQIYKLAESAGLITYNQNRHKDSRAYRDWLKQYCATFGLESVTSATGLSPQQRAKVIKALESLSVEQLI